MTARLLLVCGLSLVAACQGRVDEGSVKVGSSGSTGSSGGEGEDAGTGTGEDSSACPEPYHGTCAACRATCSTPAGAVHAFTSVEDYYAAIEGQWLLCDPSGLAQVGAAGAPSDTIGIEWGPAVLGDANCGLTGTASGCGGGNFWYLVQGPSGPVRGAGFDYELTYDISVPYAGAFQMNVHPAPDTGYYLNVKYSPCPTEIELTGMGPNSGVLVPIN